MDVTHTPNVLLASHSVFVNLTTEKRLRSLAAPVSFLLGTLSGEVKDRKLRIRIRIRGDVSLTPLILKY